MHTGEKYGVDRVVQRETENSLNIFCLEVRVV